MFHTVALPSQWQQLYYPHSPVLGHTIHKQPHPFSEAVDLVWLRSQANLDQLLSDTGDK